jgi:hypothetical protein
VLVDRVAHHALRLHVAVHFVLRARRRALLGGLGHRGGRKALRDEPAALERGERALVEPQRARLVEHLAHRAIAVDQYQ